MKLRTEWIGPALFGLGLALIPARGLRAAGLFFSYKKDGHTDLVPATPVQ